MGMDSDSGSGRVPFCLKLQEGRWCEVGLASKVMQGSRARAGARGGQADRGVPPGGARKQLDVVAGKALGPSEGAAGASCGGCMKRQCWQDRQTEVRQGRGEGGKSK